MDKAMMNNMIMYKFSEVDEAPERPGIYAWYGKIYASIADYKREIDENGNDLGASRLRKVLAKQMIRYHLSPLNIRGAGTFGSDWAGALEDRSKDFIQELILGNIDDIDGISENDKGFSELFSEVIKEEKQRDLLVKVLNNSSPLLTSPIYIGVTNNIKRRLSEHVKLYRDLKDALGNDEDKLDSLRDVVQKRGLEFAHRAIVSG
ncbi:MAG: hypothetical protein JZU65_23025, partial [Chlorobium sp.]|nr:hypothetical protein [Chlorobium sp.]